MAGFAAGMSGPMTAPHCASGFDPQERAQTACPILAADTTVVIKLAHQEDPAAICGHTYVSLKGIHSSGSR